MATLNLSSNGPSIKSSYEKIVNAGKPSGAAAGSPTYGQWAVFSVSAPLVNAFQQDAGKESVLKVQSTGEGELVDLVDEFSDGRIQFAFVKVKDPNTTLPKNVLIAWCGEGVPERTKGYFTSHLAAVSKVLHGYHVQVTARSDRDLTPESIVQKVADASGAKYSGGPASTSGAPPPPIASKPKPVFTPTRVGGSSGFNPLGSRTRAAQPQGGTDGDGWGEDAPPVTRTQLEKVESAYKPTKVNMAELTKRQEPSRYVAPEPTVGHSDVVRGGYQPIGKVDIAALRREAKEKGQSQDDRPAPVKGAYEPVGKVDIAAIRAKAQAPSPAARAPVAADDDDDRPRSLAERSAAFSQSERMTAMPKPKVANKFGGSSTFTGTKAPTPGGFTAKTVASAAPVGVASRTFADQGGKTPAQLWAEKKAREGGSVTSPPPSATASITSPLGAQKSGGGWESGYTGKKWASVQTTHTGKSAASHTSEPQDEPEDASSPAGGVSAMRDRFKGAVPMGAPSARAIPANPPSPPPLDNSSKPNMGVPMPGLPSRPVPPPAEEEEEEYVRPSSPVRIAMPVGRSAVPEPEPEEEEEEPAYPTQSIAAAASAARGMPPEPQGEDDEPARGAAQAAAATTFGSAAPAAPVAATGGRRALVQYDYEKAEDNEIELREGDYVTNIDMVDEDWWMGTNAHGDTGLFPSNYVEIIEDDDVPGAGAPAPPPVASEPEPAAAPAAGGAAGPTATAQYDYGAAEENELSFPDGAKITGLEFPDDDWWFGHYGGKSGLFPANYVELDG